MSEGTDSTDVSGAIGAAIPYLRRFSRAMTGSQESGDSFAAAALEAILADRTVLDGVEPRVGLFRVLYGIWASAGAPVNNQEVGLPAKAQERLAALTNDSREALLLHTIEDFSFAEIGEIIGVTEYEAQRLVDVARQEMADSAAGSVLIIEDEAIIAMDIESIVAEMGHRITGIARTRDEAVALGTDDVPDLILTDIQLADNSSGIDAVNEILGKLGERPVIFITAFPERLLTGEKPEPAFLITKPYSVAKVQSAVSQAMFFASTLTLTS